MRGRSLSGHFLRKYPAVQCITAQAETRLFFDMRQRDHIRALSAASGATAMRPQTARADGHNPAHQIDGKCCSVFFNELKPHGFWLAKNTVAFFNTSRSSLRIRVSCRSRSFSWARLKSSFDTTSGSRCAVIHLFSVDIPTPRSSATRLRVNPLVSAIRTASWRNSSVRFSPLSGSCFA